MTEFKIADKYLFSLFLNYAKNNFFTKFLRKQVVKNSSVNRRSRYFVYDSD